MTSRGFAAAFGGAADKCRVCGCTAKHRCIDGDGVPCIRVLGDLCSWCAESPAIPTALAAVSLIASAARPALALQPTPRHQKFLPRLREQIRLLRVVADDFERVAEAIEQTAEGRASA